jgi:glycosyltransferase involved in cell wall biosynthesis
MKFLIVTHVPHIVAQNRYFAYAPFVNEMNIWSKYVTELIIVAPFSSNTITPIDAAYEQANIRYIPIENFDVLSLKNSILALSKIPKILVKMYGAMQKADHIHLRCPGNIGLLGCILQMLFPSKLKTAKYAGNWDPDSTQPWTYKLQSWILNNSFLTRNMQVLVYGEWLRQSKNIKPFFTATYSDKEKLSLLPVLQKDKFEFQFIFVGALVKGKNPLYAIQLVERLLQNGYNVTLTLYGEGVERVKIENYITSKKLTNYITLEGNKNRESLKQAYLNSHFVVLPSDSEGWPKAIAEGMFWGCVPIAKPVSCVASMLDYGDRGVLIEMDLDKDTQALTNILHTPKLYFELRSKAADWSRQFTLEKFEEEIKNLLHS